MQPQLNKDGIEDLFESNEQVEIIAFDWRFEKANHYG